MHAVGGGLVLLPELLAPENGVFASPYGRKIRPDIEFCAEGSGVGFHVAARKTDVFIHQYSSVLGKLTILNRMGCKLHFVSEYLWSKAGMTIKTLRVIGPIY